MSNQYQQTDAECSVCEGTIYKNGTERFCDNCSRTNIDSSTPSARTTDNWQEFFDNRPEYHTNDNVKKCIGGFLEPYEWGEDDGIFKY